MGYLVEDIMIGCIIQIQVVKRFCFQHWKSIFSINQKKIKANSTTIFKLQTFNKNIHIGGNLRRAKLYYPAPFFTNKIKCTLWSGIIHDLYVIYMGVVVLKLSTTKLCKIWKDFSDNSSLKFFLKILQKRNNK